LPVVAYTTTWTLSRIQ